ncbi:MAG: hypothetical protein GY934_11650 [Gammaproteobacteria bacterium]|nr:hypothetical protein [Gammaproteobacteria bacterium]
MEKQELAQQLKAFELWKKGLIQTISDYRSWLQKHRLKSRQAEQRIDECIEALNQDRLTVAFVAEFSRGKTELINAIFFADYGRRLLPSTAGRTTMCPTEMFYDHKANQAYVRLLPIETRLEETSLNELKKKPAKWVTYPLDLNSTDQVEDCLREVVKTRRVGFEEAVRLGMYDPAQHPGRSKPPSMVDIPKWRHALISFPHPLLKQGLVILDTPGLNALGSEPELTLNMLPSAQAVLFVLAADAGVTRTDLEMWQNHIKGFQSSRKKGLMVVLNKIDTLWDELQTETDIREAIEEQSRDTATILGVKERVIFPVSAQKGLLAKIRQNNPLLDHSNLPALESYLSEDILNARQEIVQETITSEISGMLDDTRGIVTNKLTGVKKQLKEMHDLDGKSADVIEHMMTRTREEQAAYMRNINGFQASRKVLQEQAVGLRKSLDMKDLEQLINQTHRKMAGNWTTTGMKNNMRGLFDEMRNRMQTVVEQSEQSRKLIRSIYHRFHTDHGFSVVQPRMFSIMRHRVALEMLNQEAEVFRNSTMMAMTEKHFVVKRFFVAMVSKAKDIFYQSSQEVDIWLKSALEPLVFQIRDHKEQMEERLRDLKKISHSRDTLEDRITELQRQHDAITRELTILRNMHISLNNSRPLSIDERPRPRLVATQRTTGRR